jgi:hypothetical protein
MASHQSRADDLLRRALSSPSPIGELQASPATGKKAGGGKHQARTQRFASSSPSPARMQSLGGGAQPASARVRPGSPHDGGKSKVRAVAKGPRGERVKGVKARPAPNPNGHSSTAGGRRTADTIAPRAHAVAKHKSGHARASPPKTAVVPCTPVHEPPPSFQHGPAGDLDAVSRTTAGTATLVAPPTLHLPLCKVVADNATDVEVNLPVFLPLSPPQSSPRPSDLHPVPAADASSAPISLPPSIVEASSSRSVLQDYEDAERARHVSARVAAMVVASAMNDEDDNAAGGGGGGGAAGTSSAARTAEAGTDTETQQGGGEGQASAQGGVVKVPPLRSLLKASKKRDGTGDSINCSSTGRSCTGSRVSFSDRLTDLSDDSWRSAAVREQARRAEAAQRLADGDVAHDENAGGEDGGANDPALQHPLVQRAVLALRGAPIAALRNSAWGWSPPTDATLRRGGAGGGVGASSNGGGTSDASRFTNTEHSSLHSSEWTQTWTTTPVALAALAARRRAQQQAAIAGTAGAGPSGGALRGPPVVGLGARSNRLPARGQRGGTALSSHHSFQVVAGSQRSAGSRRSETQV